MPAEQETTAAQRWAPTIPNQINGQLRIPLPDDFEVTEAWWSDMLYEHKGRFPQITADRYLTLHEGNFETSRVSFQMLFRIASWMERDQGRSADSGCGLASSASFTLPSGARRSSCGSWISPQRMPNSPRPLRDPLGIIPDLVIEVPPPSLNLDTVQEEMLEWIDADVRLGWLIDPFQRTVWIYRANGEIQKLDDPAELSGEGVCPGLVIDMSLIWD